MFRFLLGLVSAVLLLAPLPTSAGGIVPRRVEVVQYYYPPPAPVVTSYYYPVPAPVFRSYSFVASAPVVTSYVAPAPVVATYYYRVPVRRVYSTMPWPASPLILVGP
jgi:hypothetical protein